MRADNAPDQEVMFDDSYGPCAVCKKRISGSELGVIDKVGMYHHACWPKRMNDTCPRCHGELAHPEELKAQLCYPCTAKQKKDGNGIPTERLPTGPSGTSGTPEV
jgi:hypothetical protein